MAEIPRKSKTQCDLGVHIELYLSLGHSGVAGNVAPRAMTMYNVFSRQTRLG